MFAGSGALGLEAASNGAARVAVMLRTLDGAQPQWGIASADVLIEGVTEGNTAGLMALFADVDRISKVGPVGPGRDLFLQAALPLNAMPVSIDKNVYAANLLNTLAYQDLDGYHVGKTAFAFDQGRQDAGYREENCWYTTGELIRNGAASYGTALEGSNTPLFRFGTREEVAPENRSGMSLTVTFSKSDSEQLNYNTGTGLYEKLNADGSPMTDADNGQQAAFTNVFVLYASSGIKDDGYTRQYDMTGGTGLYLHGGAWEQISWSKEDATGPFSLTAADGTPLTLARVYEFATTAPLEEISFILEAARMNRQVAEEGLSSQYGLGVGKSMDARVRKHILSDDLPTFAIRLTAAAADARMAGVMMPVMSNSGSGNQGITCTMPVVACAIRQESSNEDLARALMMSHLTSIHIKHHLGRLSAHCGAMVAATAAGCGIALLLDGDLAVMERTIRNMVGNVAGMICDGAKSSCALKVATAVGAGIQAVMLALDGSVVPGNEGITDDDIEVCIANLGRLGSTGMKEADKVILDIMLKKS